MANIATKFGLGASGGIHSKDPWLLVPQMGAAAQLSVVDSASAAQASTTTAFFTQMAARGLQDTTNWTADTYKTILNVTSGKGLVAAYIGCTAGGAETHTVEITVDGVLTEIAIGTLASGERATLHCGLGHAATFTTASDWLSPGPEELESNKATFGAVRNATTIPPWFFLRLVGSPMLRFNQSLLIRAKHSASITNSTATAYSAVMYRLGL